MLTLLLADAELERVPASIMGHPQVVESARRVGVRPTEMLLDSSLHYAAMRALPQGSRRGRPDLVHLFLLTVLESIPNKQGRVRVVVHTRHNERIDVNPKTRLIRNYNRFCGLVQQLFRDGRVGEPEPLLSLTKDQSLSQVLERLRATPIVLDPAGEPIAPRAVFHETAEDTVCIIGGFPSGDFVSPLPPTARRLSIHGEALTVWTVAAELLAHYPREAGAKTTR